MKKRLLALLLVLVLSAGLLPVTVAAVSVDDPSVFLTQQTRSTCTLASATMMLRRRAILDGDANWADITEGSVRRTAWTGGLAWNFSYHGLSVSVMRKASGWAGSSLASKRAALIELLAAHPEGIVAYASGQPHAVLLTDYDADTGTFYCCDPAPYYFAGRVPLVQSSIKGGDQDAVLGRITQLWYISGGLSSGAGTMPVEETLEEPQVPTASVAWMSSQDIDINGTKVAFQTYVVVDDAANETCYVNATDLAAALKTTAGQFDVTIGPEVLLFPQVTYPYDSCSAWENFPPIVPVTAGPDTRVDGQLRDLDSIAVTDYNGNSHIYYKLRDLGDALGFHVDWNAERGTYIETEAAQ